MEDMVLTLRVVVPEEVFMHWSDEQIEQYIHEQLNDSIKNALKKRIDIMSKQLIVGKATAEPVGICPQSK